MKKLIIFLVLALSIVSCNDVLDKEYSDALYSDDVWNSTENATLYLNTLYLENLPTFNATDYAELSEEATGKGEGSMMYGKLTTSTSTFGNFTTAYYNKIRKINILLDEIDGGTIDNDDKVLIKAQAYFLRAWAYWEMVKLYGGVPMILNSEDPFAGDDLLVTRDPASTCIATIVADLDTAIADLPASYSSAYGRITRGGAAALKGRVLLFYASPQFNPDNLIERWEDAYEANKEAYDLCIDDGYKLYDDYSRIFLDENEQKEALFVKCYDETNITHTYESTVRPAYENAENETDCNPTWQMVKAYPMADGYLPGDAEGSYDWDSNYYWKNRDPRFYKTIAYNGCIWGLNSESGRRQWNFVEYSEELGNDPTKTGFYCRRNVDTTIDASETNYTGTDWIEIRLAEVYLNLAECAAETGELSEAKELLYAIRKRAGIEEGDGSYGITASTSDELVDAVMLEREIEFAYENKRHWDLRRRNLYKTELNGTRRSGIYTNIKYPSSAYDTLLTNAKLDSSDAESIYRDKFNKWIQIDDSVTHILANYYDYFEIDWDNIYDEENAINYLQPKYNFYYITQDVLDKNKNLKQTVNWTDSDGFDPLED